MTAERGTRPVMPACQSHGHKLLEGLTTEQRQAVTHGQGPLLIQAGPGSGKTRVLTTRIAFLLATEAAKPWEVLAVTFSVRAADELKGRLRDMLGVEQASGVRAATFHSVCARLLRSHPHHAGRSQGFTVYDPTEVRRAIDWLISEKQRGEVAEALARHGVAAAEIQREISTAKNRLIGVEEYEQRAPHAAAGLIARVWRELEQEMRKRDAVDFDDMLVHTVRLLAERPHVLAQMRSQYRWLLVDELQDTNAAQLELVCLLAAPDGNLTAVGDHDQCIYTFRAADVGALQKLAERFPGHTKRTLRLNYRSHAEILEPAWRCVSHNTEREPRALIAHRGPGGSASAHAFYSDTEEAAWVTRQTRRALDTGCPPAEILILSRTLRATRPVQEALRHAGIPHRLIGSLGLYERSEVRDALAYMTLLANPRDVAAFSRALQSPRRGIGERTISRIVAIAREHHDGDLVIACAERRADGALPKNNRERTAEKLRNFAEGLLGARRELSAGERSLTHTAVTVLTMRGGIVPHHQWVRDHAEQAAKRHDAEGVLEDLRSLIRHVQSFEQQEPTPTLSGFLEVAAGLSSRQVEPGAKDERVVASTIHGAKGGEGRFVLLIGCEERLLPAHQAVESRDRAAMDEERRLFYVAATRAKDRLAITYCAERNGRATGGPSRFLAEAGLIGEQHAPALAA